MIVRDVCPLAPVRVGRLRYAKKDARERSWTGKGRSWAWSTSIPYTPAVPFPIDVMFSARPKDPFGSASRASKTSCCSFTHASSQLRPPPTPRARERAIRLPPGSSMNRPSSAHDPPFLDSNIPRCYLRRADLPLVQLWRRPDRNHRHRHRHHHRLSRLSFKHTLRYVAMRS